MAKPPNVKATLEDSPAGLPNIKIRAGTGTDYYFNLHVIPAENGKQFPVGKYVFKYSASCEEQDPEERLEIDENQI